MAAADVDDDDHQTELSVAAHQPNANPTRLLGSTSSTVAERFYFSLPCQAHHRCRGRLFIAAMLGCYGPASQSFRVDEFYGVIVWFIGPLLTGRKVP